MVDEIIEYSFMECNFVEDETMSHIGKTLKTKPQKVKFKTRFPYSIVSCKREIPCYSSYHFEVTGTNELICTRKQKRKKDGYKQIMQYGWRKLMFSSRYVTEIKPYLYANGDLGDTNTNVKIKADLWISDGHESSLFYRCDIDLENEKIHHKDDEIKIENIKQVIRSISNSIAENK